MNPNRITNEQAYEEYLSLIDTLIGKKNLSSEEKKQLDISIHLVEQYENQNHKIDSPKYSSQIKFFFLDQVGYNKLIDLFSISKMIFVIRNIPHLICTLWRPKK